MQEDAEKLAAAKAMFDAAAEKMDQAHQAIGDELREARVAARMAQYALADLIPPPDPEA